jgi:hypothetical protein
MTKIFGLLCALLGTAALVRAQSKFDAVQIRATQVSKTSGCSRVKAARPTADFDERWGKLRRGDLFVEFVYYSYAPYKK